MEEDSEGEGVGLDALQSLLWSSRRFRLSKSTRLSSPPLYDLGKDGTFTQPRRRPFQVRLFFTEASRLEVGSSVKPSV